MTLYRAAYRTLVAQQLVAANTPAGPRVYESRALPTGSDLLPCILLQTPHEVKTSAGRGAPKFTSVFDLIVVARLDALTFQAAECAIEAMVEQIEMAIMANPVTVNPLQQFASVETSIQIDATGSKPTAEAVLTFRCEFYQTYDPPLVTPLTEIDVDMHATPGGPSVVSLVIDPPQS